MSNLELLDRAAAATMCQILQVGGYAMVNTGVASLWASGTGLLPLSAGALTLLAANYACGEMPMGGTEPNPNLDGCQEVSGYGDLEVSVDGQWILAFPPGNSQHVDGTNAVEITDQYVYQSPDGRWVSYIGWRVQNGGATSSTQYASQNEEVARSFKWRITPTEGTCIRGSNEPQPLPPEATEPIQYTDNITNCNYTVTLQGFAQESEGGAVNPVLLIESASGTRSGGGVMGGCNFPPTIYMPPGGGGGDGVYVPVPSPIPGPDGGVPWWVPALAGALGGALANQVIDAINDALAPTFDPATFTLTAPCEVDDNGVALTRTWEFLEGSFQERMNAHQVALMEILQQHLNWKTPTCDCNESDPPEGDFRTISFRSDETSPYGKSRLRKRFRYRSVSGNDLGAVVDHWKDFSFEGGPYRVRWIGGSWGTVEVWAASEAEGKRVIQHAAAEAGFDPFENGRWSTRATSSARLGVRGAMRVDTTGGYYWITARDGSDQRPMVAKT